MNWLSYFAVEDLAWLGMSGMVKDFRKRILQLTDWSKENGSHTIHHSKVPVTYIWSPSLVPRPPDWPHHCEVRGMGPLHRGCVRLAIPRRMLCSAVD